MKVKLTKGACLARCKETFACSSLGFRYQNMSMDTNSKKGGMTLWRS